MGQTDVQVQPHTRFRVRLLQDSDRLKICSWVPTRQALDLVSGDTSARLTLGILSRWEATAVSSLVVGDACDNNLLGFCTLSTTEVPRLPTDYVELCHLIVQPGRTNLLIGSRLVSAARVKAYQMGYRFGCGRVTPMNRYGLALARLHRAEEITATVPWATGSFRWFRLPLSSDTIPRCRPVHSHTGDNPEWLTPIRMPRP